MNLEKRIERLERRRPVSEEQKTVMIFLLSNEEPKPTDEEIEIAKAEFIEKYPERSMMMIDFPKGITLVGVNGELLHSDRLKQLRTIRINNMVTIQPPNNAIDPTPLVQAHR